MILEIGAIALGMIISFFLKDVNFLGLNFEFLGGSVTYPDFLLIFLVFFALHRGEFYGIWIGFFAGLLEDSGLIDFIASSNEFVPIIGVHAAVYTLAGFTLGKIKKFIDRSHAVPQILIVLGATFIIRFVIWILMGILEQFNHSYAFFGPAIYTAIIAPLWFVLLSWLYRIHEEEDK